MDDTISRAAAIDAFKKELTVGESKGNYVTICSAIGYKGAKQILESLPSVQSEIVACGDCIHWICHDRRCGYWNHGVKPLDWCCHAERRTE